MPSTTRLSGSSGALVGAIRTRLRWQLAAAAAGRTLSWTGGAVAAGLAATLLLAWWRGSGVLPGVSPAFVVAAAVVVPLAAATIALLTTLRGTPVLPESAAIEADRRWDLRERLSSAIALQGGAAPCDAAVAAWVAAQAEGVSRGRSAAQAIPDASTRPLAIGAGLAVLAAVVAWSASGVLTRPRVTDPVAALSPAGPPSAVRTLLASIEEEFALGDPALDDSQRPSEAQTEASTESRFAALEEEVARLAADPAAADPRERFEAAAELDAMAERLRQRAERSAAEQERLAERLQPLEPREMPPLAQGLTEALRRGDWESAAERLEALGGVDPELREAVLRSLADAMERLQALPDPPSIDDGDPLLLRDPAAGPEEAPTDPMRREAPESPRPAEPPGEAAAPAEDPRSEDRLGDVDRTPDPLRERFDALREALREAIGEPPADPHRQGPADDASQTPGTDKKSSEMAEEPLRPAQTDAQSPSGEFRDLESDAKGGSTPSSETGRAIEGARDPRDRSAGQEEDRSTETRVEKGADPSEVDGKGKPEHLRSPEEARPLEDAASEEDPTNARKVSEFEGKGDRPRLEKGAAVSIFEEDEGAERSAGDQVDRSPESPGSPDDQGGAAGEGVADTERSPPSAEQLLREWAGEARDTARARRDARRLEELARRLAGGDPGADSAADRGADPDSRDRGLTRDRPTEPRTPGERPQLDLRPRPDRPGAPPATPIAQWLDTPEAPTEGAAEWLRRSPDAPGTLRAAAERAIETGSVHPRHHRALQRYFARLEQAVEEGAPRR